MTCIVGIEWGHGAVVGGDSAGVSGWDLVVRADEKVFRRGPFVMGFTSSFRMGQLLRYRLEVPEHPEGMGPHEYMATAFVDSVRECLKAGGYATKENEQEEGGTFIVGYRSHVYTVESDYQVGRASDGFMAIGCGHAIAAGALWATRSNPYPIDRVGIALNAAERLSAGVRGPFTVLRTPTDSDPEPKSSP